MTTLTELLNDPEVHYPGNFDTPERAVALLTGLCQDAATEIERLNKAQKRKWVGLTEEEVNDIVWNLPYEPSQEDIRAIEAKLKEKNHD